MLVGPPESVMVTPEFKLPPETLPEIVQFVEQPTATVSVNDWVAFEPTPLLAVIVTVVLDGALPVPLIVAVPLPLSVKVIGLGSVPEVTLRAGTGFPVVVTLNEPFTPWVNVTLLALVICGGEFTVIVTVDVCLLPAVFVTVSVYVVVEVGDTDTPVPLVTAPTPLLMLPVPLLNVGVMVVEFPETIVVDVAVKLAIAGAATTVTVAVAVTEAGVVAAFVTVSV